MNAEPPLKRRRINQSRPSVLENARLHASSNAISTPWIAPDRCRKYGDLWIHAAATDALNASQFPTDFSASAEECLSKPGIHVWLLFADGTFGAARVLTTYELGSKHLNVYERFGRKPVAAAGEAEVRPDGSVVLNFESGTFMLGISERFSDLYADENYRTAYEPVIAEIWQAAGATAVTFTEGTMIRNDVVPLTEELLRTYDRAGLAFRAFPTQAACRAYLSYHAPASKVRRNTLRKTYERTRNTMKQRYGRNVGTFDEWAKSQKYNALFQEPPEQVPMFRNKTTGGSKSRRRKTRKAKKSLGFRDFIVGSAWNQW